MYRVLVYIVLWFASSVHGALQSNSEKLFINLTTDYYKDILPSLDHKTPVQVSMYIFMGAIMGFEEKDARFSVTATLFFSWYDHRMTWNSSDYGDVQAITIPITKVWVPPISLFNAYSDYGDIARSHMKVRCFNGNCAWYPTLQHDIHCSADVTFYPFDSHTCYLYFATDGYDSTEINMTLLSQKIDMTYMQESPLWELDQENSKIFIQQMPRNVQIIVVGISFKRRPAFQIANLIIPTCLIGILNSLVFVLPAESGERVGFTVTMLLAMAVFQTIVSDSLPTAALPSIPRLCYFLLADLIIGTLITVSTMFVLPLYYKKETERGTECLKSFASYVLCKRGKKQMESDDKIIRFEITWYDVGKCLDNILFCIFLVVIIIKNILLLIMITEERSYSVSNTYSQFALNQ